MLFLLIYTFYCLLFFSGQIWYPYFADYRSEGLAWEQWWNKTQRTLSVGPWSSQMMTAGIWMLQIHRRQQQLTRWKRPWCWERLRAGGEGKTIGWDGWMASLTQWIWFWVIPRSWWWTGMPAVLWFMGSQRVGHDWATELKWTEQNLSLPLITYTHMTMSAHTCTLIFSF